MLRKLILTAALIMAATPAMADSFYFGFSDGGRPRPVVVPQQRYYAPPVYYAPRPAYYVPRIRHYRYYDPYAAPVVVAPAYGYGRPYRGHRY